MRGDRVEARSHLNQNRTTALIDVEKARTNGAMYTQLYMVVSCGLIILGIMILVGTADARPPCLALLKKYDNAQRMPDRDDPMRAEFIRCYYVICGIKLDSDR